MGDFIFQKLLEGSVLHNLISWSWDRGCFGLLGFFFVPYQCVACTCLSAGIKTIKPLLLTWEQDLTDFFDPLLPKELLSFPLQEHTPSLTATQNTSDSSYVHGRDNTTSDVTWSTTPRNSPATDQLDVFKQTSIERSSGYGLWINIFIGMGFLHYLCMYTVTLQSHVLISLARIVTAGSEQPVYLSCGRRPV